MTIEPFTIAVPQATLDDLRERLARTRWLDQVEGAGWTYGIALDYMKELARRENVRLQVTGAFNGCWSGQALEYIVRNFTEISLSLDGLPEIQNRQRPAAGGGESFPLIDKTLKRLDREKFRYGIRMTVTESSVSKLEESIDFICKNYHPVKIQAEPVFEQGRALDKGSTVKNLDHFVDGFIRSHSIAKQHGVELFYSGSRPDIITTRFCLAACRAFVVTADGDITTCFESYGREHPLSPHFLTGNLSENGSFEIDRKKLENYFRHTVNDNEHCRSCFCKWHCAGDCAIKTMRQDGDSGYQTTERCAVNREITRYLILDKIKANGGLFWFGDDLSGAAGIAGARCC